MGTILLIENNHDLLSNLTEAFEMEGYKILAAENGNSGVDLAREFMPDLIVSEILIGSMNGYDVLKSVMRTKRTADIPFIFSTTKCEKRDRSLAIDLGADDYIVKPYELEPLFAMVKMWIKSGRERVGRGGLKSSGLSFAKEIN